MRDKTYTVQADLKVERVEGGESAFGGDEAEVVQRLVATRVQRAWCQYQSGAGGGCHHCCQLLQLVRLLQLTEHELETWNPMLPTSVACKWILKNCGGRRGDSDIFHRKPVAEVAHTLRTLRDPKRKTLTGGEKEPAHTKGVVAMDRRNEYSSHPDHGKWAGRRQHFDEGISYSATQWAKLSRFVDGERVRKGREDTRMAVDFLRPMVRPESP